MLYSMSAHDDLLYDIYTYMRLTSSVFIAGSKVNELMATQDRTHVAASSLLFLRKPTP